MINELLHNDILLASLISWFVAQFLKIVVVLIEDHRLDLTQFWASGGMPSSHSSFVMTLTWSMGLKYGFNSPFFTIAMVFGFIVMYDAANVRLESGKQAMAINRIIEALENKDLEPEQRLKEILGHTPLQVVAGAILGVLIAIVYFNIKNL